MVSKYIKRLLQYLGKVAFNTATCFMFLGGTDLTYNSQKVREYKDKIEVVEGKIEKLDERYLKLDQQFHRLQQKGEPDNQLGKRFSIEMEKNRLEHIAEDYEKELKRHEFERDFLLIHPLLKEALN